MSLALKSHVVTSIPPDDWVVVSDLGPVTRSGILCNTMPNSSERLCRGYTKLDVNIDIGTGQLNPSRGKNIPVTEAAYCFKRENLGKSLFGAL